MKVSRRLSFEQKKAVEFLLLLYLNTNLNQPVFFNPPESEFVIDNSFVKI